MAGLVSSLEAIATQLEGLVRGLEPARLESCDVLSALDVVARLSKLAEAGRTVLAGAVQERGLHAAIGASERGASGGGGGGYVGG